MQSSRMSFLPKSRLGWWSVLMLLACLVLFIVAELVLGSLGNENRSVPAIALTAVTGMAAAGALAAATISVVKNRKRSVVVFVVMALGLYQLFGAVVALLGLPK